MLVQVLTGQLAAISEIEPGKLGEPLKSPIKMGPLRFESVGEVVKFAFIHETIHLATIICYSKAIGYRR